MGYILNRFDKLMKLRDNPAVNEQFKLTAIIVHDPKDKNFIGHLRECFLDFAEMTGKRFLFITFIQPPIEYAEAIRRGEYEYAKYLVSDSKQLSNTDTIINPLLRDFFHLPQNGSYLVVAKRLLDKECFLISTSTGDIFYQLRTLKNYCKSPYNFDELIKKLKGESLYIKEMILGSLLKIASVISPSSPPKECGLYSSTQLEMAKKVLVEEKQKLLVALKQSSEYEDMTKEVMTLYSLIDYAYRNVFNQGDRNASNNGQKCNNFKLLDGKSKTFWNTYSRLFQFIEGSSRDELDYSAFILYLGKIVETELNLSVCQMLRQSMGIDMPRFYNRYCDKTGIGWGNIPTKSQNIPLNKFIKDNDGNKTLEGVPLGNLLHAYKTAVGLEDSSEGCWTVPNREKLQSIPQEFLALWDNIVKARNNAAHCRLVDADLFNKTEKNFREFQETYVSYLYALKEKLRPVGK